MFFDTDLLIQKIDKAYEDADKQPRYHLGASEIGHKCDRWLWLSFRHAIQKIFPGRMLRLFKHGHHWEDRFVEYLESCGIDIRNVTTDQKRVDFGCHISGSADGLIYGGLPFGIEYPVLAEFKTSGDKPFQYLLSKGVSAAKNVHYVQMQLYMHALGLSHALYVAENKNDSNLHIQIIKYRKATAVKQLDRAKSITMSNELPDAYSQFPECFECNYCFALPFCTTKDLYIVKENCRTCRNVSVGDGTFLCTKRDKLIPQEHQLSRYKCYEKHEQLINPIG